MWKKEDEGAEMPTPQAESMQRAERPASPAIPRELATIGRSIRIHGEVSGDEDLLIQGRVEGSVDLKQHSVTVGPDGVVKASVVARLVMVEGRVEGNVTAEEQVVLRKSASVDGDIKAPRVVLEDGARFRGGVDMGEKSDGGKKPVDVSQRAQMKSEPAKQPEKLIEKSSGNGGIVKDTAVELKS